MKKIGNGIADSSKAKTSKAKEVFDDTNIHAGHRLRQYAAILKDLELTTFSDVETLECLLYICIPRIDTNVIAHHLLKRFGSLDGVFNAEINELTKIPYITERIAIFLKMLPAVVRKANINRLSEKRITGCTQAVDLLQAHFEGFTCEKMFVMNLDAKDRLLGIDCVSSGGTSTAATVNTNMIIESVIHHNSTKVIVAHNHPRADVEPSIEDISTTNMIIESLASLSAVLVDHIIFNDKGDYMSMYNSGIIAVLYGNFDLAHGSALSVHLLAEDNHKVSRGQEYVFDLETAMTVKKTELDYFTQHCYTTSKENGKNLEYLKRIYRKPDSNE